MYHRRTGGHQQVLTPGVNGARAPLMSSTVESGDNTGRAIPVAGAATTFPKRRRRTPRRTNGSSSMFAALLSGDGEGDTVGCIIVLVILLAALVCGGSVVILWILQDRKIWSVPASLGGSSRSRTTGLHDNMPPQQARGALQQGFDEMEQFPELPASPIYTIPHSMAHIGDRSDKYAALRKTTDEFLPYDPQRSLKVAESLRRYPNLATTHAEDLSYDIYNCPDEPPPGYPYEWATTTILRDWNPDNTTIPSQIHQGLCVFDYQSDYLKALTYRNKEVPFVVRGDPSVSQAVERWNTAPNYLDQLVDTGEPHRAEYSDTNHFMYWVPGNYRRQRKNGGQVTHPNSKERAPPEGWSAPTKMIRMAYSEWITHANITLDLEEEKQLLGPDQPHWYFRLIGCGETGPKGTCDSGSSEWLFDELPFFQPRPHQLYLTDPGQQRGIHCRFGMTGVTVANHFDGSRNAIVVLGGERRYILSRPQQCPNFCLYPQGHPSSRHSGVDWSLPTDQIVEECPEFADATSNEVVLQAGDVLYLPTMWFHYIVSLSLNFQCNTRSGMSTEYEEPIRECGF